MPPTPPAALSAACAMLWQLSPPAPGELFKVPAFAQLRHTCESHYDNAGWDQSLNFALYYALRSLGLPCLCDASLTIPSPEAAAQSIHQAFQAKAITWIHLCPLNLASPLPPLKFGPAELRQFSKEELSPLFGWDRLLRHYPSTLPSLSDLAQFQWLVVHETRPAEPTAAARALPALEHILSAPDPARIDPHTSRLPAAVERALFFLLLAPWEDWSDMPGIDWRGFTVPWVYSRCDDLFVQPPLPPSARSLSWEPKFAVDRYGEEVEWEAPVELPLRDEASDLPSILSDTAWALLKQALPSPLFETPVAHFLVRAYLSDGIDEFLAHLTLLEAALGTVRDHQPKPKTDPHKSLKATSRMAARVSALLGSSSDGATYRHLFDLRSAFIHGRPLQPISVEDRIAARRLARRVVQELVGATTSAQTMDTRDAVLDALLDKGASLI